jgi:hypothetical protein
VIGVIDYNPNNTSLNVVAYRVLCLLKWLKEGPKSISELISLFYQEPLTLRAVSDDTIGLYVNTLRQMGCVIQRPSKTTHFCYVLHYHPFGIFLNRQQSRILSKMKSLISKSQSLSMFWALQQFFDKVYQEATPSTQERLNLSGWAGFRDVFYVNHRQLISDCQDWIYDNVLLRLVYLSPVKNKEKFYFLPKRLVYEEGAIFIEGAQKNRQDLVELRLDRVVEAMPILEPTPRELRLIDHLGRQWLDVNVDVKIRFYTDTETYRDSRPMQKALALMLNVEEGWHEVSPGEWEINFKANNFFRLKQKLLSSGCKFNVLQPLAFKQEMQETLRQMHQMYLVRNL